MEEDYNQVPIQDPVYEDGEIESPSSKKKIISLVIGVVVVLFIVVLALVFILPRLKPGKAPDVTLTYWGVWEEPAVFADVIADFQKSHPNITIRYEKQDIKTLGKYVDRLQTRGPDIFRFHNSWVFMLNGRGLLAPLPAEVVNASEIDTKYYDVIKKDLKVNGAYYGIPLYIDTLALFVNNDIFKKAGISSYPTTWDDFLKENNPYTPLTVKDSDGKIKTSEIALGTIDNIAHATDIISLIMAQNGAVLDKPAGDQAGKALEYYTYFSKGDNKVWDDTLDNSKLSFIKGDLAMYFGYSWDIFDIKAKNATLDFTVVPVPHLPGSNKTIASYWVEGVSSKSKYQKEAFEFLKFLTTRESLEKMYAKQAKIRLFGSLYPRLDMADLLKDNPLIYPFVSQAKNAESTIFSSDTYDDADVKALNGYLGDAVRSVVNGQGSVQSAVETLGKGVASVMSKYGR